MTGQEVGIELKSRGWQMEVHLLNGLMANALYKDIADMISERTQKVPIKKSIEELVKIDYQAEMLRYAKLRGL